MRYHRTLEVELQFINVNGNPEKLDYATFLPESREKEVVTVVDVVHDDRVLHSSPHDR